ncbi:sarcosine oxidase subunit gamma [Tateyamaria sp. ANG-S1]|uniref:sarcosine oxidase subunit gamma n=1 Tax=Tateyamaria sp. ANG-S1 TaxID=1577905 RepID=UPI00057D634C|nr:sarcosine oxidase subunit gamma [Tateyamaria sp. ANG-S1]KIC47970.1 sarcosine oxidase subunit gamma [Tateyamaria sp. ANG-S1]
MADLIAKTPLEGMDPVTIGTCTVAEVGLGTLTSISPYAGAKIADTFKTAHGMAWPAPNRATGKEGARAIWFGRDMVLLAGPEPDKALAKHAALTDQSDAWTAVTLSGAASEAVLARLIPLDLSAASFKRGHTARTQIQHMTGSVTRVGADTFLLMVFRSMAGTLLHDLERAMASVVARG